MYRFRNEELRSFLTALFVPRSSGDISGRQKVIFASAGRTVHGIAGDRGPHLIGISDWTSFYLERQR